MSGVDVDVLVAETRRRYAQLGEIFADGILAAADEIVALRSEREALCQRLDEVRAVWWDPPDDEGQRMEDLMGVRWCRSGLKCELIEPAPWRTGVEGD